MIKNIALLLACASLGTAATAKSSNSNSDGAVGTTFCVKYINGVPRWVVCK
jgi:hypothetical protein